MPITWRPAKSDDIEPCLAIQPHNRGEALVGSEACLRCWQRLVAHPFFMSAVLEADPVIQGHRLIGFAAAIIVSSSFFEKQTADPQPDIASRLIAQIHSGEPVLATRNDVALANAGEGIDVVAFHSSWRDEILSPENVRVVQTLFPASFAEQLAGFRVHRILAETAHPPVTEFHKRSVVYQTVAEFPEHGRVLHLMSRQSVELMPASVGNIIFTYTEPTLRLRDSDQQLLLAALRGATDQELTSELGITSSAVKARWRSIFARIEEVMPALVSDPEDRDGRGTQKRHRVLAYVRSHMEDLRPYQPALS